MTCKKIVEVQPIDRLMIVKETSSLGKLIIKGVPKEKAKCMIVENHYSHKWCDGGFGKYNFGIFRARTRQMPRSGRLRVHEESEGKDIHAFESPSVDV